MDTIGIDELEMAINQWRVRRAQPLALCREVRVLADVSPTCQYDLRHLLLLN
ncbi:DUF3717 domain-containing protein (plasmid) [Robbsia andropogonis]|uniref:DUF3717 domain-containing protein n=1 Tax=Robbsia andropogonis TaxID=28092 RepID=UPI003D25DC22